MNTKRLFQIITTFILSISVNAQNEELTDSIAIKLQEVVVTANQPVSKLEGTTLVSTIPGSNLVHLGNAFDLLAQLPMISVSDNTVNVVGRNKIEIYIDGRQISDEYDLYQILSSDIKKVELMMVPGVAYNSTTDAVIKITTKRSFIKGLSVNNQFQLQCRRKWSVKDFIKLNYSIGGVDFFLDGSYNHNNMLITGMTTNSLLYNGKETIVGSRQNNSYCSNVGAIRGGFNYAKGNQSLGGYYRYNPEHGNFGNTGAEWMDEELPLQRNIGKEIDAYSHLVSVYYENKFADKFLLHFDGDYKHSVVDNSVVTTYPSKECEDVNSTDNRHSTLWSGKLYLSFSMAKGDFTVGVQNSYTHTALDYRMLNTSVGEYIPSSLTDARQTSAAVFASWARRFGNFSLSTGMRYEYIDYSFIVDGNRDDDASRKDNILTPDISLGYSFDNGSQICLNYKMSTVKPPYSQLTGVLNYVGRHEIEGGNPSLRDEKMHDIGIFGMWHDFIFQTDLTRSLDTYAFVKRLYPAENLQLQLHPINIDVTSVSAYLVWRKAIRCWTPNITAGIYKQWLSIDGTDYNKPIFSYYFDNTFALPKGWSITADIRGSTNGDMHTNRFGTTWFTMDASFGKVLFNKSLTIKISVTDIFNTANNDWSMNTYGVSVKKCQRYDNRGISCNIIYQFNPRKSRYKGDAASESEMNRL